MSDPRSLDFRSTPIATWAEWIAALRELVPGLDLDVSQDTQITDVVSGDRIAKGLLFAGLRRLMHDPPDQLLSSMSTLGEAFEWSAVRAQHTAVAAPSRAGSLADMRAANVRLRPVADSDIPDLYASALDPRWSCRWRYRGATPSIQEFAAQLSNGILAQFIVERNRDHRPVGLVTCYSARTDQGWAYIAFSRVSSPTGAGDSEMLEGGFLFITFLFRNWQFRKLYAEVPGWNWERFEQGAGAYFTVEGLFTDHEYFDGRYWDTRNRGTQSRALGRCSARSRKAVRRRNRRESVLGMTAVVRFGSHRPALRPVEESLRSGRRRLGRSRARRRAGCRPTA